MSIIAEPIKVLIADDQTLFRRGLATMLNSDPRMQVVGQAKDGVDVVEQALSTRPDVVLMDLQMPKATGVEATRVLAREAPGVKVLLLSAYADATAIGEGLASGAKGFINKDVNLGDVVARILEVRSAKTSGRPVKDAELSGRELSVLKQVAVGLSNKQIARRLGISEKTVRNHLSRVFNKLMATNRTEAVMNAMRAGLLII